jgi:hypothetical protein
MNNISKSSSKYFVTRKFNQCSESWFRNDYHPISKEKQNEDIIRLKKSIRKEKIRQLYEKERLE